LGSATRIALVAVSRDVLVEFRLERLVQHAEGAPPQQLVQRHPQIRVFFRRLLDYAQHGWRLLRPAANRDVCVEIHTKGTPPVIQAIHNIGLYLQRGQ
jgi:hypothetical protein